MYLRPCHLGYSINDIEAVVHLERRSLGVVAGRFADWGKGTGRFVARLRSAVGFLESRVGLAAEVMKKRDLP
jgi:hypothetical protein